MKRKIYYYDTDCGGVVYHANYLNYFEEARTDELEKLGLSVEKLREDNCFFVVNHQEIFYKYPAYYGDILEIDAKVVEISPVRMVFEYNITNQNGKLTTQGTTSLVCIGKEGHAHAWPDYFKDKITVHPRVIKTRRP